MKIRSHIVLCALWAACLWTATAQDPTDAQQAGAPEPSRLQVVCTTTILGAVVEAVGGPDVAVHALVPFGMCPGHFDLSPAEARRLREADLLLRHGFERFLDRTRPGENTQMIRVNVNGNWMVPEVHVQAVNSVLDILTEREPAMADTFRQRAKEYIARVRDAETTTRNRLNAHRGTPVIASFMNRDLVEWYGFRVIATFPRDEEISVKVLHEIISKGRDARVKLVLDNRQSSGRIGHTIAQELDVPMVMLNSYPDASPPDTDPPAYLRALAGQVALIQNALAEKNATARYDR